MQTEHFTVGELTILKSSFGKFCSTQIATYESAFNESDTGKITGGEIAFVKCTIFVFF